MPPKIVPYAFVSRGIMSTRMAGSFHFGSTGSEDNYAPCCDFERDCST